MENEYQLQKCWFFSAVLWKNLRTVGGEPLIVLNPGQWNTDQGPDFKNSHVNINGVDWHGQVEIHLKTSFWFLHSHTFDPNYKNVMLHVVWQHDCMDFNHCPVLELRTQAQCNFSIHRFSVLNELACHGYPKKLSAMNRNFLDNFGTRRLLKKVNRVIELMRHYDNDLEEVIWVLLARSFGQKVNADTFEEMANAVSFRTLRKLKNEPEEILIVFMGLTGLLDDCSDPISVARKQKYFQLQSVYRFRSIYGRVYSLRMRPSNFPIKRMEQLCSFICQQDDLLGLFTCSFDIISFQKSMATSMAPFLLKILYLNVLIPIQLFLDHSRWINNGYSCLKERLVGIKPEDSRIIRLFKRSGIPPTNAFDTQSMLELYNTKCQKWDCKGCPFIPSADHQLKSTSSLISG